MKKPGEESESSILVLLLWVELKTVMEPKLLTEIANPIDCGFSGGQLYECSCAIAQYLVMILSRLCAVFYWHRIKVQYASPHVEITSPTYSMTVLHPSETAFC